MFSLLSSRSPHPFFLQWDFLVFRHNEHQVEAAKALAKQLGFTLFNPKKTGRFIDEANQSFVQQTPVRDSDGQIVRHLEMPLSSQWQNEGVVNDLRAVVNRHGSLQAYFDVAEIQW